MEQEIVRRALQAAFDYVGRGARAEFVKMCDVSEATLDRFLAGQDVMPRNLAIIRDALERFQQANRVPMSAQPAAGPTEKPQHPYYDSADGLFDLAFRAAENLAKDMRQPAISSAIRLRQLRMTVQTLANLADDIDHALNQGVAASPPPANTTVRVRHKEDER